MKYCLVLIPVTLAFLLGGCMPPYAVYPDIPMVELDYDGSKITLTVPDEGASGWAFGDGYGEKEVSIKLTETAGKKAYVEKGYWKVWDEDDNAVAAKDDPYVPVKELEGGKESSFSLSIGLDEWEAYLLDHADGTDDQSGEGTIKIQFFGYDERAIEWSSTPLYLDFEVED